MIKLFASDLDGTLLGITHRVDETVVSTIQKVLDNKRYFTIATGRTFVNGLESVEDRIYKICQNGAVIYAPSGKVIYHSVLDKDIVEEALNTLGDLGIEYIDEDKTYLLDSKEEIISRMKKRSKIIKIAAFTGDKHIEEFLSKTETSCTKDYILSKNISKLNYHIASEYERNKIRDFVNKYSDRIINAASSDDMFEITEIHTNKGEAVKRLANLLNVKEDEVAVYGDGGNDIQMLDMFEHSYSPIDASGAAKAKAKNIIGPFATYSVCRHIQDTLKEKENV